MPHSMEEKKRVVTRLRRIQGQALALERAVVAGTECGALLQQLAALRGAATGLMAEVLESHLRETFGVKTVNTTLNEADVPTLPVLPMTAQDAQAEIDQLMRIIRTYLK